MADEKIVLTIALILFSIIILAIIAFLMQLIANFIIIIRTPKKNNYKKEIEEIKATIENNNREILYELKRIRKVIEK